MDPQSILRLMAMFGQQQQVPQTNSAQVMNPTPFNPAGMGLQSGQMSAPPPIDQYDPLARFKQLYNPRTDISQQYSTALGQMPQRQPISAGRGIGAIAASALIGAHNPALGYGIGQDVINGPYDKQLGDWNNKVGALGKGAAEEDRYNVNQRQLADETVRSELADQKQEDLNKQNEVKNQQNQEKISNAEARTEVYRQKMEISKDIAKGGKLVLDKAGNYQMVYRDGSVKNVDMKGWTPADIASMKNDFAIQQIDERGGIQSGLVNQRGQVESGLIQQRGNQTRQTKQTVGAPSGNAANDSESVVEVKDNTGKVIGTRSTKNIKNPQSLLRQKATEFLTSKGLPVTDANIQHAIDKRYIK